MQLLNSVWVDVVKCQQSLLLRSGRIKSVNISYVGVCVKWVLVSFIDAQDYFQVASSDVVSRGKRIEAGKENKGTKEKQND